MNKQLMLITVRGKDHAWSFTTCADPHHLPEWRADGLEIYAIENIVPTWVPALAFRTWCFVQDVWNFRNPFRREGISE